MNKLQLQTLLTDVKTLESIAHRLRQTVQEEIFRQAPVVLTDHEQHFIMNGRKIEAIKSIRERLGVDLMEAKDMADSWDKRRNG